MADKREIASRRLDPATGLADSFDPNANSLVLSIAQEADGKIIAGGDFSGANSIGGQTRNFIARLDPVTGLADSFDPNASSVVFAVAVQPDGKILAGGISHTIGGQTRNHMARLDPASGLADSYDPSISSTVFAIAVQQDDKVVVGGDFTSVSPIGGAAITRNYVARMEIDGRLDQTLNRMGTSGIATIALQADGKILVGGVFSTDFRCRTEQYRAAEYRRYARPDFLSGRERPCLCHRSADGWKNFSGRFFHRHWRPDAQPHRAIGWHYRLG